MLGKRHQRQSLVLWHNFQFDQFQETRSNSQFRPQLILSDRQAIFIPGPCFDKGVSCTITECCVADSAKAKNGYGINPREPISRVTSGERELDHRLQARE